jgi:hypothetical protein
MRKAYNIMVRKPEGKIPLGKTMHGWQDNIGMGIIEIGYEDVD